MDTEECFRLEHHHTVPRALRLLYRFRPRTDASRVPFFDGKESGTSQPVTSKHEQMSMSLRPLEPQYSPMQTSSLQCLPEELLFQIMIFLPHSSLYMIHQTCGIFRHLLGGFEFKSFRLEMLRSKEEEYCITKAGFDELYKVKRLFRRGSLCGPCGKLFDSGELEEKLKALWHPVRCTGCNETHPELLFPQNQRTENRCVGLLGHFSVCKHLKISGRLQEIPFEKTLEQKEEVIMCEHPDHISVYDKYQPSVSDKSPRLPSRNIFQPYFRSLSTFAGVHSQYGRSFPLMKIHRQQDLDMRKLKSFLVKQLQELDGDGLCQHASGQLESIASFMTLGKHPCFSNWSNKCYDYDCSDCTYACNQCGARYSWVYEKDCVVLRVRMHMYYTHPDAINWVSNLCFESDEHPVLNSSTENVLWCSNSGCGTGCGERWLLMVEIFERHTLCSILHPYELSSRHTTSMDRLPLTLEYQSLQDSACWLPGTRAEPYRY